MPAPVRVAILGFSAFERSAITSYFGLNPGRMPRYELVDDVDDARMVVADADQPGVAVLLRTLGRTAQAVFIGDHPPAHAGAWMMRPISPAHLLRELDGLLVQLDNPGSGQLPLSLPSSLSGIRGDLPGPGGLGRRAADDVEEAHRRGLADARRRLQMAARDAGLEASPSAPRPLPAPAPTAAAGGLPVGPRGAAGVRPSQGLRPAAPLPRRALLVDDSEIALHFLRRQLSQYGVETDVSRDSEAALGLLGEHRYGMVFVDVDLGDRSHLDGLGLCQEIRHRQPMAGPRPLVAMVSAFHDPVDQVRGTLAGADAYLGKPLDFAALDRLLGGQGLKRLPEAPA